MTNKIIYLYNYVYRITDKVAGMHYYGARSCNIDPKLDIGFKYFGSPKSKIGLAFLQDQKDNPGYYKYKIIKLFATRKLAIAHEILLHNKFNVGNNSKFYNQAKQTSTGWDTSGIPRSIDSRQKQSIRQTGSKRSVETCQNMSKPRTDIGKINIALANSESKSNIPLSSEHRQKISDASLGVPKSAKTRQNMRKPKSREHRNNIGNAHRGKPKSPEYLAKYTATRAKNKAIKLLLTPPL